MKIEIPDDHLVFLCGGNWKEDAGANISKVVLGYLYGKPHYRTEREAALGIVLVRKLADQLRDTAKQKDKTQVE